MPYAKDSHPLNERRSQMRRRALVVDGDALARVETRLLLEMHGYQVEEVSDGMEAIGLLDVDAPALDLVVLDYEMPLLGALDTLHALQAFQPGLKALLCVAHESGLPAEAPSERVAFLKKPCTLHGLSEALDKVHGITRHMLGHGKLAHSHRLKLSGHLPHYPPR